jgi:hypothetical protein
MLAALSTRSPPCEDTMTERLDPLATAAAGGTIQRWFEQLTGSEDDCQEKLTVLEEFCRFCGETPDALIASLFRPTGQPTPDRESIEPIAGAGRYGPRIVLKRRRQVIEWIDDFEADHGGRAAGNVVRSFLIHNGVALTARPTW